MENNQLWMDKLDHVMKTHPRLKRLELTDNVLLKLKDRFIIKVV